MSPDSSKLSNSSFCARSILCHSIGGSAGFAARTSTPMTSAPAPSRPMHKFVPMKPALPRTMQRRLANEDLEMVIADRLRHQALEYRRHLFGFLGPACGRDFSQRVFD